MRKKSSMPGKPVKPSYEEPMRPVKPNTTGKKDKAQDQSKGKGKR